VRVRKPEDLGERFYSPTLVTSGAATSFSSPGLRPELVAWFVPLSAGEPSLDAREEKKVVVTTQARINSFHPRKGAGLVSKADGNTTRITVAYNEVVRREALGKMPDDMQGDAIPDQVLQHEKLLKAKRSAKTGEKEKTVKARKSVDTSARLLTRLRKGILSAYNDEDDPRIEGYGPLGVTRSPAENIGRLEELAEKIRVPLASGEIALVADLQPDVLVAQIAKQKELIEGKAGAKVTRQVKSKSLTETRAASSEMLQRIKNWVKSFYGASTLTDFGFDLPLPVVRPRLSGVDRDTSPLEDENTPPT
jgi:hypothetical protein